MDKPQRPPVVAVVGGATLAGREVRDVLAEAKLPAEVKLIGAEEEEVGSLTEQAGEAIIITALDEDNLRGSRLAFLVGSASSSRQAREILAELRPGPALIDLTYEFEEAPDARLRAPWVEPPDFAPVPEAVQVVAHPAAVALALFLSRLHERFAIVQASAHVFEPASERGQRGIDELKQQTVNLLTFKPLPQEIFDAQLGFNLLARYGSEALAPLEGIEQRIERHLATLLAYHAVPMPSLRLIQAPVFHGHSFSVWVEFDQNPGSAALEQALAEAGFEVRKAGEEPPTNVGAAGQSGLTVGALSVDSNQPRAAWFWVVSDNLRVSAENAVAVARGLLGQTP